jgi:arylsulfatase A-like enzyme
VTDVLLLVVDSLRKCSLGRVDGPRTPFLDSLRRDFSCFERAYSTECWTLPAHASMFTGLLPSQHGAHFQNMAYTGAAPTTAELLAARGYATELVTRNYVFDGTIPGITRGFAHKTCPLSESRWVDPVSLFLAAAKPRFRRHLRASGFFHPFHRGSREFLGRFARALRPADDLALAHVLARMRHWRQRRRPFFVFCNLYDVHAPYSPSPHSILRPLRSWPDLLENVALPYYMSRLGAHRYLRPGFRVSRRGRELLRGRYHRAIELMDAKLGCFFAAVRQANLLDDTLVIVTSDHGEAFGEHDLFLHDASVYDTHLHVPLWIHCPEIVPRVVDEVVSTRDLFGLMAAAANGGATSGTILDPTFRAEHPVALAEHIRYPHIADVAPQHRGPLAAAIMHDHKVIVRGDGVELFAPGRDEGTGTPIEIPAATSSVKTALDALGEIRRVAGSGPDRGNLMRRSP